MTTKPSSEFSNFKEFVRKIVSVPKSEIDAIKEEEELKEKKKSPKKQAAKAKPR